MLKSPSLQSIAFPDAGIYVMRSERIYLLASCQPIGINGVGAHKHNDWLSFELCVDGQPIIIDPGTYCYTGNMEMRRLFRSTAYHNTVVVDGKEQVEIHNSMFGLIDPHGDIRILRWESGDKQDLLEAEHTGYTRLSEPVIHRRCFLLNKRENEVDITDTFTGDGKHSFEWHLHLDVGLDCRVEDNKAIISKIGETCLEFALSDLGTSLQTDENWVSSSYNVREKSKVIRWQKRVSDLSSY